jgi:hypothetical protein
MSGRCGFERIGDWNLPDTKRSDNQTDNLSCSGYMMWTKSASNSMRFPLPVRLFLVGSMASMVQSADNGLALVPPRGFLTWVRPRPAAFVSVGLSVSARLRVGRLSFGATCAAM